MNYHQKLLSKNGFSTTILAKEFLVFKIGSKIPTVTDFNEKIGLSRGTIQNSIKFLQENKAIKLESKGHLGTFLISKNTGILLSFAGITSIVGVMPLPYSKKYEGFATGLISAMENQYDIHTSMAYMRGAENRIGMLLSERYDFAVVSRFAAEDIMKRNDSIDIVKGFGLHSYLSEHIILFHNPNETEIRDGMKVAIDLESIDQRVLTKKICTDKNVEYINIGYNQILQKIIEGSVDAAIWNEDEITDKMIKINYRPLSILNYEDTEAVIVTSKNKPELSHLINDLIEVETVKDIQKLVLEGKITPNY